MAIVAAEFPNRSIFEFDRIAEPRHGGEPMDGCGIVDGRVFIEEKAAGFFALYFGAAIVAHLCKKSQGEEEDQREFHRDSKLKT